MYLSINFRQGLSSNGYGNSGMGQSQEINIRDLMNIFGKVPIR